MPPRPRAAKRPSRGACRARFNHVVRNPRGHSALRRPLRSTCPRRARRHPRRARRIRRPGATRRTRDHHAPTRRLDDVAAPSRGHARAQRSPGCAPNARHHDLRDARAERRVLGCSPSRAPRRRGLPSQVPCRAAHRRGLGSARRTFPPDTLLHPNSSSRLCPSSAEPHSVHWETGQRTDSAE